MNGVRHTAATAIETVPLSMENVIANAIPLLLPDGPVSLIIRQIWAVPRDSGVFGCGLKINGPDAMPGYHGSRMKKMQYCINQNFMVRP
jgi:hypothetical protein